MALLSASAVLALAMTCQNAVAPKTILDIVQRAENKQFNTVAINRNADGTYDAGLMQINSGNFKILGLHDPFDPCESIRAEGDLLKLFSKNNTGSPTKGIANGYALKVAGLTDPAEPAPTLAPPPPARPACAAPSWDTWGRAQCDAEASQLLKEDPQ